MLKSLLQAAGIAAVVFVFAFVALAYWYSSRPAHQPNEVGSKATQEQNSREYPKDRVGEGFWERATTDPIAFFTLWLAVFTALLVVVASVQIGFLINADATAEKGAEAAKSAANAARASVELAKNTAEKQLRAYVFVDALEIRKFGTDEPPEGWLDIKNSGETAAYDFERAANVMYTAFPATSFPDLKWPGAKGYVAPKGEIYFGPIPLPRALTKAENDNVIAGTHAIYLFGMIRYRDAFGHERTLRFRSFHRGNGQPISGTTLNTQQDIEGNSAD